MMAARQATQKCSANMNLFIIVNGVACPSLMGYPYSWLHCINYRSTTDPCCGSGHILVYMFDVLMQIYESYGYTTQEAVSSIIENNLYGLDIDERAAQLSSFSVMMKARSYDRRFFNRKIQPHVYAIKESNGLDKNLVDYFVGDDPKFKKDFYTLTEELHDAKEYGSILNVTQLDFDALLARVGEVERDINFYTQAVMDNILPLILIGKVLATKFEVVVTNPPYMGSSGMSEKLAKFVRYNYPNTKADLSTVFMEKTLNMTIENGYMAMINIPVWMFLVSFEKQRISMLKENTFSSLVHLGRGIFGADFGTVSFVVKNKNLKGYMATYLRLFDSSSSVDTPEKKAEWFIERKGSYFISQDNFNSISGSPIAYWISEPLLDAFKRYDSIGTIGEAKQGLITGNNERFLREWYEVESQKLNTRWYVYNKGGEYRKWYGNNDLVVNWENDGFEIINYIDPIMHKLKSRPQNVKYYFRSGFTWTTLSIGDFSARYMHGGQIFDAKGSSYFANDDLIVKNVMALSNSKVGSEFFKFLSPTVDYSAGSVAKLPIANEVIYSEKIGRIVDDCIELSKSDWDSFEISWDFQQNPFIRWSRGFWDITCTCADFDYFYPGEKPDFYSPLKLSWLLWKGECNERFRKLKQNEEKLNRIFIDIYGLQDELTPEVKDKNVTVRKADLQRDIKNLISYAVGCMFGRYSLDVVGLAYAGGEWDASKYQTYIPDYNGILPICDDEYFTDDIVGHFVDFIRTVYGEDTLEENLQFIADALGGKGSSREVIRNYFLNDFYKDHCKIYQKRPIYWMFDSGKKNGFKCLIYLHRYRPDTIARIRTDYVHEQQARYRTAISELDKRISSASTSESIKMKRALTKLQDQAEELIGYEEKIHHLADRFIDIDLDDGVKVNYAKFQDVLAKIK